MFKSRVPKTGQIRKSTLTTTTETNALDDDDEDVVVVVKKTKAVVSSGISGGMNRFAVASRRDSKPIHSPTDPRGDTSSESTRINTTRLPSVSTASSHSSSTSRLI
jgi:hypothetical protein